jgi:hypothetical protein
MDGVLKGCLQWVDALSIAKYLYFSCMVRVAKLLVVSFMLVACNSCGNQNSYQNIKSIDSSKYAILKYNENYKYLFEPHVKPTNVTYNEIAVIENLIAKKVTIYNKETIAREKSLFKNQPNVKYHSNQIQYPENYFKRLIAVTNQNGEKIVWVNCFCTPPEGFDWRKNVLEMSDGGSCYFNLKLNLTKNSAYDFRVNNYE